MNLLKTILSTSVFAIASVALHAQLPAKVESFPVRDVRLTASPFKHAEDMDIRYLLGIDPDRLLAPYLKEAGLSPKAENYTNWENTGLDGHIGGHYLSALSYMYAATGNKEIKARLDYMISELKRCQDAAGDGYLCGVPNGRKMWKEIEEGNIRASGFGLNDRWVPLYNIHKIYAGLRDATLQTDSREAKEMLVKLTDWMIRLVSKLSDEQIQDMLRSEHGGLNETFADVAAITGDKRYLKLAHQFSHHTVLQPLLRQEDKLTGMHANTQIPKVIGFKRIAASLLEVTVCVSIFIRLMTSAVCSPASRGLRLVTPTICSALQKCCMKRVRTFILWIITNGRFITISFPRKILCKADLFILPRCVPVITGSIRSLRPVSGVVWDRGWKIMPVMVK